MVVSKKFTLKYMDGHEEHYENYRYYERLRGNEKITRNGKKLYKAGKVFFLKSDDYWVEYPASGENKSEFTLEFKDGSTKDFINYAYHARLHGDDKISRTRGRLYYQGKVFEQVVKDYWVETEKLRNRRKNNKGTNSEIIIRYKSGKKQNLTCNDKSVEFVGDGNWLIYNNTIFEKNNQNEWLEKDSPTVKSHSCPTKNDEPIVEYKNGRKRTIIDFDDYVKEGVIELKDDGRRMYCDGRIFVKIGKNHWLEDRIKSAGRAVKFKLIFSDGTVKEFENYKKCSERTDSEKIVLGKGKKSLTYHGYRFIRDTVDRHTWKQDTTRFNKLYDKFYLTKDWNVWEFENMQSYFNRDDNEHMKLTKVDRSIKHKGKSVKITRCITYKGTRYYNIDNWKVWVNLTTEKYHKEKLNHSNKIPITKFYKEGVWYFTPDKKTRNYRHFLKSNEIYVFSNKYAFWSGALWEKEGKVWYYRKPMLKADKVEKFIIPLKEDEYYFKAEIKHLRKMGYKINYRYIKSKRQQPNKRNAEQQKEFMEKVTKMSRADRKKALTKKKKRQGKYRERRGL